MHEMDLNNQPHEADHLKHARVEFNKNRKIIIKNVPPITYDEIKDFCGRFAVSNISISKKFRHAIVTMLHGDEAEGAVTELRQKGTLLDTPVEIDLYHNENLMCITHLPFNINEDAFHAEMKPYGTIERCFLMRFHDTGKSKGYGFVEYAHNKELSEEACQKLNGRRMGSCIIQCSFVDSQVVSFDQLHSRCLLIDHLPMDYNNIEELKQVCSAIQEPCYCKLGEKEERMLGFGLVQYDSFADAESSQARINGHKLANHSIRVTFCMPGKTAESHYEENVEIRYQRLMALKTPLPPPLMSLPTPAQPALDPQSITSPVIKRLLGSYTDALSNFSGVLALLQGEVVKQQSYQRPGLLGRAPTMPPSPLMNPDLQIALLAVLLAQQIQLNQPQFVSNPNTQHYILSSLQTQNTGQSIGSARPSLLGNPFIAQANTMLSSIKTEDQLKEEAKITAQSTIEIENESSKSGLTLFPRTNQELNANILANFNQLLTTLNTPPTKSPKLGARIPQEELIRGKTQSKSLIQPSKSGDLLKNDENDISCKTDKSDDDVMEVKPEWEIAKNKLEEVKQEPHINDGLLGPVPGFPHAACLSGNPQPAASNPFFHIPGVGLANPFLATFIEQQIRTHIQTMHQQLNLFGAAMSLQNQQKLNVGNDRACPSLLDIEVNTVKTSQPGGSLLGAPPVHQPLMRGQQFSSRNSKPGLLGASPAANAKANKPQSLLGTPTTWNRPQQSGSLLGQRMPEKRTLTFDDTQSSAKRAAPATSTSDIPSLLGDPPFQKLQKMNEDDEDEKARNWEGFCKALSMGQRPSLEDIMDVAKLTNPDAKPKPLMDINVEPSSEKEKKASEEPEAMIGPKKPTEKRMNVEKRAEPPSYGGGEKQSGDYRSLGQWGEQGSEVQSQGYEGYDRESKEYQDYMKEYQKAYKQYEEQCQEYWRRYGHMPRPGQPFTDPNSQPGSFGNDYYSQYNDEYNQWRYDWDYYYGNQYNSGNQDNAGYAPGSDYQGHQNPNYQQFPGYDCYGSYDQQSYQQSQRSGQGQSSEGQAPVPPSFMPPPPPPPPSLTGQGHADNTRFQENKSGETFNENVSQRSSIRYNSQHFNQSSSKNNQYQSENQKKSGRGKQQYDAYNIGQTSNNSDGQRTSEIPSLLGSLSDSENNSSKHNSSSSSLLGEPPSHNRESILGNPSNSMKHYMSSIVGNPPHTRNRSSTNNVPSLKGNAPSLMSLSTNSRVTSNYDKTSKPPSLLDLPSAGYSSTGSKVGRQGNSSGMSSLPGKVPYVSDGGDHQSNYGNNAMDTTSDKGLMPPPGAPTVTRTPGHGMQKNPHLLPSPEPSPDTTYVGQHSQGIGGHYADSYSKRY